MFKLKNYKRAYLIAYIVHANNSRPKGRLLFGGIMYGVGYLMWVMQVRESWCVAIGPKEGCHTIGPYYITLINYCLLYTSPSPRDS